MLNKHEWNNNKFLWAGDKFMPKMHLRQTGFMYSACGPFTKSKKRLQKEARDKKTGNSRNIYQKELNKASFQHAMTFGDFKDLPRRTASDEVLCDN